MYWMTEQETLVTVAFESRTNLRVGLFIKGVEGSLAVSKSEITSTLCKCLISFPFLILDFVT